MMRLKHNNRGFTLVELIAATAILGIVALAASGFMVAGARTYSSVNYSVRLQYEAHLAMAQLQEYTVDCNKGIAWDNSKHALYIVNDDTYHLFRYNAADQKLYYGTGTAYAELGGNTETAAIHLLAEHVTDMDVSLGEGKAEITLDMQRNNKAYHATQVVALRNQPVKGTSWATLWNVIKNL